MADEVVTIAGRRCLLCDTAGPLVGTERDATDLIGDALGADAQIVIIPVERLAPDFFRLASGFAGAVVQKFVNYQRCLVILGDVVAHEARSAPFRDFVREANRGRHLRFVPDRAALEANLRI